MKMEITALLTLAALFSLSLFNIHKLTGLTGEIAELAEQAGVFAEERDWENARVYAEKAVEKWDKSDAYTHMVLRHSEIESAADTLGELLKEIYSENTGGAKGAATLAATRMRSVASIESLRLGSIF